MPSGIPVLSFPMLLLELDFSVLRKAGYRGAVFDKDNCITIPHKDALVPEDAFSVYYRTPGKNIDKSLGRESVLIVSNSAGSRLDAGQAQAESISYHLSVPVLRHDAPKPAYSCIASIRRYFSTLATPIKDEELAVVGDQIFTDVVMANRMRRAVGKEPHSGPLAVRTTDVWQKKSMVMQWIEKRRRQ